MKNLTSALLGAVLVFGTVSAHADDERQAADAKYAQDRAAEAAAQRREAAEIRAAEKEAREAREATTKPIPTTSPTPKTQ